MSDSNDDIDRANDQRRTKLVKAGVAVGIGSAAIVAALLYASKIKKKRDASLICGRTILPAASAGHSRRKARNAGLSLAVNGSVPVSHLSHRVGKMRVGVIEELAGLHVLVGAHQPTKLLAITGQATNIRTPRDRRSRRRTRRRARSGQASRVGAQSPRRRLFASAARRSCSR